MAKPQAAAPAAPAEGAKRQRTSFSREKKIGYMLLSAMAILNSKAVAAVLTEEQKAKAAKMAESVKALKAEDPFETVNNRIAEIQKELQALKAPADMTNIEALTKFAAQAKELSLELDRQIKKKNQITELLGK